MAANLFQPSLSRATDSNGRPVNGAKMFFYLTGTTTPATWFTDAAGTVEGTNPLVSDSTGLFDPAYLDPDTTYRIVLKTADEATTIWAVDPVRGFDETQLVDDAAAATAAATAAGLAKTAAETARDEAVEAETGAVAAESGANASVANATSYYPGARSHVPQGATVGAGSVISGGSGGTNGTFALAFTGGNFAVNPTGTFTVAGGALTAVTITGPGLYVGGSISKPTLSFTASTGLTGAAGDFTTRFLRAAGEYYLTEHASDPLYVALFQNQANAAVEVDASVDPFSTGVARDWSQGTEPGGPGTFSAKEYAEQAAQEVLNVGLAAQAVEATASLYANGLSNNDYAIEYESVGALNQATLASNVGVYQVGLVNGTHIFTGDVITGLRWLWAAATGTVTTEILVWERDVAGATGAGTLNNAAPIATHDTLIATITTTPAALGITTGTSNPAQTNNLALAVPITVKAGFDLMFQFRNLDGSSAVVNCGIAYIAGTAGSQRRAGFTALTATPTTFVAINTARLPSITLLKNVQKTRLPATDETLRTLSDNKAIETLASMNQRNVQNLYASASLFPTTLDTPASYWGDSLTNDATSGQPITGYRLTEVVDALTVGTVNNYGINGQTSAQITTRVTAGSGTDLAGFNRVMQGTNDLASGTPASVLTNYDTCAAAFTNANYLMSSPWMTGVQAGRVNGRKIGDIRTGLLSTYGAKALDSQAFWARYGFNATDQLAARRGAVPTDLTIDGLHKATAGGLIHGHIHAAALIAQAGGAPFVHDDIVGIKNGDASGTAIITPRILGTGYNFAILAGNEDGALQINRKTGAITRTASPVLQPYREVFVEGENNRGRGRNGRIVMVQQLDGTTPNKVVRVRGNGASVLMPRFDFAATAGPEATIVLAIRQTRRASGASNLMTYGGNNSPILDQNGWDMRVNWRGAAGASLGSQSLSVESPSLVNFYAFTMKTDTGVMRSRLNLGTPVTAGAVTAANIDLAGIAYLFSNGGDSAPWAGDILMMAVYGAYYDITSDAIIGNWWDNTTRLPKDIGDGTAGGAFAAPLIYLRGMAGDHILGKNYGTGGDLHAQIPLSGRDVGFVDVDL